MARANCSPRIDEVPQKLLFALGRLTARPPAPFSRIESRGDGGVGRDPSPRTGGEPARSGTRGTRGTSAAQRRFDALAHHANVAIVILAEIRPIFANAEAARLLGYPTAEDILALKSIGGLVTAQHRAGLRSLNRQLLTGRAEVAAYEVEGRRWDGRTVSLKGRAFLIPWEEGNAVCHTLVDVTDRKEAEAVAAERLAELAHFDRVATLDRMATTVVHEIMQPLLALSMAGGACKRFLSQEPPDVTSALGSVDAVVAQAQRMRELSVGIRRFASGSARAAPPREPIDAVDAAAQALQLLSPLLARSNVKSSLSADVPPELRTVYLNPVQLSQVVVNLQSNAIEAIRSAGTPEGEIVTRIGREGDKVIIEIEDDGPGLAPEDADRVFEPYFSSKDCGMGLGLAVCQSIVEEAGGTIEATNGPGGGALFRVRLPAYQAMIAERRRR